MNTFRIILIEDDPMVQAVNRQFVEQVEGFQVAGVASDGREGLQMVRELLPDLVIIDIYMPGLNGIETLKQIRLEGLPVDVIVITAAKDAETIQKMLRGGAVDYLIKPFEASRLRQALTNYRNQHGRLENNPTMSQSQLDHLLLGEPGAASEPRTGAPSLNQADLPKGLNAFTLKQIWSILQTSTASLSAEEVADKAGLARVTARRYLDHLEKNKYIQIDMRYGGVGRPINRYSLVRNQNDQK